MKNKAVVVLLITVLCLAMVVFAGCAKQTADGTLLPGVQWGMTEAEVQRVLGEGTLEETDGKHSRLTLPVQVGGVEAEATFSFYLASNGEEAFPADGVRRLISIELTGKEAMEAAATKLLGKAQNGDSAGKPGTDHADSLVWQSKKTYGELSQASRDWLSGYQRQLFALELAETETILEDTPLWRCYILRDSPNTLHMTGSLAWGLAAEKAVTG